MDFEKLTKGMRDYMEANKGDDPVVPDLFAKTSDGKIAKYDKGKKSYVRKHRIVFRKDILKTTNDLLDLCDLIVFETDKEVYAFPIKKRDLWEKQIKGIKRRFLATYESKIEIVAKWDEKEWELV